MIRLLLGITLSEVGGSQQVVYQIISKLPEHLYDISLVTSPGGELVDWISSFNQTRENKVRVIALNCIRRNISPFYDFILFWKLILLMMKNRYDVVHFHNSKMGTLGRPAAWIVRVPKIYYTVHGWGLNKSTAGPLFPILSMMERISSRCATKNIFVSRHDLLKGLKNGWASVSKSRLIYNGISEEHRITYFHEPKDQDDLGSQKKGDLPVIAFVARLAAPKEPVFAIQVSAVLLREGYEHKLMIVGDGPMMEECRETIYSQGLGNHVMLLGKRDDVMNLLRESDIFCLYSKWEGFPLSVLEAMSCGLPVVASNVGGIPELVVPGETGFLVSGYDPEQAAVFLIDLIQDQKKRITMGNAAKEMVYEKFHLNQMILEYRWLYEE